ncbi:DUF3611 family protein [Phormidesmis sp. 146-33]
MTKSDPPTLRQIASTFRLTGWISFWVQLALTVISSAILLLASLNPSPTNNPGTSVGVVLTVCGIGVLGFNMFWALVRYVSIGRRLDGSPETRPKKADAIHTLRTGLIASLIGTLLALFGAQAIVGLLVNKAVNQGVAGFVNTDPNQFIKPVDILVVQASINVILAQFCAISASLWLLNKMSRQ